VRPLKMTKLFANLKSADGECHLTGKKTLGAALTSFLDSEDLAKRANFLNLERGDEYRAYLSIEKEPRSSNFGLPHKGTSVRTIISALWLQPLLKSLEWEAKK
jgi:hypothetical protein